MVGEEGLKRCMPEEEVCVQEGLLLKMCSHKSGENVDGVAVVEDFISETENSTEATAPIGGDSSEEEKAPKEKMTRLPQEEVDWILSGKFHAPSDFEALKLSNPDLTPPPDEEMDESTKLFYDAAKIFYDGQQSFFEFQEEVRKQYEEKHYVEVDDEYLATREYNRALILETCKEVCGDRVYSDDDEDEDAYSDTDGEGVSKEKIVCSLEAWLLRPWEFTEARLFPHV